MADPDSPQNLYAKNLQQTFGYPLRFPEPKPGLPTSYAENGLHIGDVGYVDHRGIFEVLFNICLPLEHELHWTRRKDLAGLVGLTKFNPSEVPAIPDGIAAGRAICHGIRGFQGENLKHNPSASCSFKSFSASGAILILPSGAKSQDLSASLEEEFRGLAEKHAIDWCRFARCKSLYLITGLYKTNSWYLASFHDIERKDPVLLERDDAGQYSCDSRCDFRNSPKDNSFENQTVLISGFKLEVRDWDIRVEKLVPPHSRSIWSELIYLASSLFGMLFFLWKQMGSKAYVNRAPALSQPFHPSDIINRYLLSKNPKARLAITHDNEWLSMLKENELSPDDMVEEKCFLAILEEKYPSVPDSTRERGLSSENEFNNKGGDGLHAAGLSPELRTLKTFSVPLAPYDAQQFTITHMRVENVVTCLRRMPIGFFVLIQFDGITKRSKCKSASLHCSVIEWEDEVVLPTDVTTDVQFSISASFELDPMLGDGEMLCTLKTDVRKLIESGSTSLLFSSRRKEDTSSYPSLLITLEEKPLNSIVGWPKHELRCKDYFRGEVAEETDKGHHALLCYRRGEGREKLTRCIEYFQRARDLCALDDECYAVALFNHATARFIDCQVYGTVTGCDAVVASYRESLQLRPAGHPDRPGTLLHLAEALLYCYERQQCEEWVGDEIKMLVAEIKRICSENSYNYRAANLVAQTLKRYQIASSGELVALDELISELGLAARIPPYWYFDRPYRLINLGTALRKRFEIAGDLGHLDRSISVTEEAAQFLSDTHLDKPWMLASLGDLLYTRFIQLSVTADLDGSISMTDKALTLAPDGHVRKPWMLARLGAALFIRFFRGNASDLAKWGVVTSGSICLTPPSQLDWPFQSTHSISGFSDLEQAISRYREAAKLFVDDNLDCMTSLADSLFVCFWCSRRASDLNEAVLGYQDAAKLLPVDYPDRPNCLNNLALCLRIRFERSHDLGDLEEAISRCRDVIKLTPAGHRDKPRYLENLSLSLSLYRSRSLLSAIRFDYPHILQSSPRPFR